MSSIGAVSIFLATQSELYKHCRVLSKVLKHQWKSSFITPALDHNEEKEQGQIITHQRLALMRMLKGREKMSLHSYSRAKAEAEGEAPIEYSFCLLVSPGTGKGG